MTAVTTVVADPFRVAHPVDVRLCDAGGEALLYILDQDAHGQDLHLTIENGAPEAFWLQTPLAAEPRASNYHVEVRFRPGVLDLERVREIQLVHKETAETDIATWQLSHQRNDDHTVSLFVLRANEAHLAKGERVHLTFTNVTLAVAGSRTTLVEVVVRSAPAQARRYLREDIHRVERMRIVTRRGVPVLPLIAAWSGTDTILNDGMSQNELRLELINGGRERIDFDAASLDTASRLTIADGATHDADPRRLAGAADLSKMEIEVTTPGWTVRVDDGGPRPVWVVQPIEPVSLLPAEFLTLQFTNLVSDADSGHAELTIDATNVRGHWDGRCIATVNKAPLLYRREADGRARVGINTVRPDLDLAIGHPGAGLSGGPEGRLELWGGGTKALVIGEDGALAVRTGLVIPAGTLAEGSVAPRLAIGHANSGIIGAEDGRLSLRTDGVDRLTVRPSGQVLVEPNRLGNVDLALNQTTTGLKGHDDGSLDVVVGNIGQIAISPKGEIRFGSHDTNDVLELRGAGRFLLFTTPSRPDAAWSVRLDHDYGNLRFQLEPAGRLASTALELRRAGGVVAPGGLSTSQVHIGTRSLTEAHLELLDALMSAAGLAVSLDLDSSVNIGAISIPLKGERDGTLRWRRP